MGEIIYSVLIVSSHNAFSESIKKLLDPQKFEPIILSQSVSDAKRKVLENQYDIVIINSPLEDDFGSEFALDVAERNESGVVMFARPEVYDEVYDKTSPYGVLLLTKPTSGAVFTQTIRLLCATKERIGRFTHKQIAEKKSLEERLNEIRIINNAKLLLIEHKKIKEEEAHRYLEKRAMDLRKTKIEIAQEVISEYHK